MEDQQVTDNRFPKINRRGKTLRVILYFAVGILLILSVVIGVGIEELANYNQTIHRNARASLYKTGAEFYASRYRFNLKKNTLHELKQSVGRLTFVGSKFHWWDGTTPPKNCIADEITDNESYLVALCWFRNKALVVSMAGPVLSSDQNGKLLNTAIIMKSPEFSAHKTVTHVVEEILFSRGIIFKKDMVQLDLHKIFDK